MLTKFRGEDWRGTWGYVIEGTIRIRYRDHEEVVRAGEVFRCARAAAVLGEGARYLEFVTAPEGEVVVEAL